MGKKTKSKGRFQAEVHLGLLGMVCILLFLNFASNYVLFKSTSEYRSEIKQRFAMAARESVRLIYDRNIPSISDEDRAHLQSRYNLQSIFLLPAPNSMSHAEAIAISDSIITANIDFGRRSMIREIIWSSEFSIPIRGIEDEFYYVYPAMAESDRHWLVMSMQSQPLAYMEDARSLLLYIVAGVGVLLIGLYVLLSKFIISPFESIRREALTAGRPVDEREDDVEAVVDEYRRAIRELQEKEHELRQANNRIQARAESLEQYNEYLMNSMSSGLISVNCSGEISAVNHSGGAILDTTPEELIGRRPRDILGPDASITEAVEASNQNQESQPFREYDFRTLSGKQRHVGAIVSPVRDNEGTPLGISVLMNDLTEVGQLRRELEQKTRLSAMGEMAGGLAHQLRNSIGAISGYAKLIERRIEKGTAEPATVAALSEEIKQAESLIARFLNFVRPLDVSFESTNLTQLVLDVISGFRVRMDCADVTFKCQLNESLDIMVDPLLLRQAVTNLIENAILASDSCGDIVISLDNDDTGTVVLAIEDYGVGIPPDALDQIFTPFYSSRPSGSGLGLALTSKIIDMHGGRIMVRSEVGKGTVFTLTLPSARLPQPQA